MKNAYQALSRFCRFWTKLVFWVLVVSFTIHSLMNAVASKAPAHMRSSTEVLENGGRIVRDGLNGVTYYFPPDTQSGSTIRPIEVAATPEKAESRPPRQENRRQNLELPFPPS